MKKFFKWVAWILVALIIIIAGAIFYIANFVNPNDFKPQIINIAEKYTGNRKLEIKGNLGWSFFPSVGVTVNDISLSNAPGYGKKPMLAAKNIVVGVRVIPLLFGDIEADKIKANDLKINLVKKSSSRNNWSNFGPTKTTSTKAKTNSPQPASNSKPMNISINAIDVANFYLTYADQTTGQTLKVNDVDAKLRDIAFKPSQNKSDLFKQVAASGSASLKSITGKDMAISDIDSNFKTNGETLTGKASIDSIKASGYDASKTSSTFKVVNSNISGSAEIKKVSGNGTQVSNIQSTFNKIKNRLSGDVDVDSATLKNVKLSKIKAKLSGNTATKIFNLKSLSTDLYGGKLSADNVIANFSRSLPSYQLNGKVTDVNIGALLNDMSGVSGITGNANITIDKIRTTGQTGQQLARNTNGNLTFSIKDGSYDKLKIIGLIEQGVNLAKGKPFAPTSNNDATVFKELSGTGKIVNGVLTNNNLLMSSPKLKLTGKGNIVLATQAIDYKLKAHLPPSAKKPIDIDVKGNLNQPKPALLKAVVNTVLGIFNKNKDQEKENQQPASDKNTQEPQQQKSPEDQLKDAGQQFIKGLFN